jgi:hypothetical protein
MFLNLLADQVSSERKIYCIPNSNTNKTSCNCNNLTNLIRDEVSMGVVGSVLVKWPL